MHTFRTEIWIKSFSEDKLQVVPVCFRLIISNRSELVKFEGEPPSWTSAQLDADAGHHAGDHLEADADAVAHLRVQVPGAESPDQLGIPTLSRFFPIVLVVIIIFYYSVIASVLSDL